MLKRNFIIGVDFGATYVKVGKIDLKGVISKKNFFPTTDFKSREALIDRISSEISCAINEENSRILGIGIGVPGQVDYKRGIIHNLVNVNGWKNIPFRHILRKRFRGLEVFVDNDANVACLGERQWGSAKGYDNIICVTLGSGVGGGLIINGQLYRGKDYSAGEIGHICIDKKGKTCNCGSFGCLETFAGANYLKEMVIDKLKKKEKSIILKLAGGEYSNITAKLIDEAAKKGDVLSIDVWEETGRNIGLCLAGVVNLLNPEIIVIGGGVSKTGRILFDSIRQTVDDMALDIAKKRLRIVRARFVEDAGIVGAAALVKEELGL
jgi:glucokinase